MNMGGAVTSLSNTTNPTTPTGMSARRSPRSSPCPIPYTPQCQLLDLPSVAFYTPPHREELLARIEAAVLRPLNTWYAQAGHPQLLALASKPPFRSPFTAHSIAAARTRAGPLAASADGALSASASWPEPVVIDVAARTRSREFEALRSRAGRVLGAAAAEVDSLAERRLEVAAAAFDVRAGACLIT